MLRAIFAVVCCLMISSVMSSDAHAQREPCGSPGMQRGSDVSGDCWRKDEPYHSRRVFPPPGCEVYNPLSPSVFYWTGGTVDSGRGLGDFLKCIEPADVCFGGAFLTGDLTCGSGGLATMINPATGGQNCPAGYTALHVGNSIMQGAVHGVKHCDAWVCYRGNCQANP